jgi:hypothetical protein
MWLISNYKFNQLKSLDFTVNKHKFNFKFFLFHLHLMDRFFKIFPDFNEFHFL